MSSRFRDYEVSEADGQLVLRFSGLWSSGDDVGGVCAGHCERAEDAGGTGGD